ncbi:uncharacterized protein LOC125424914 [Sphaerodactylus townsendi]|uniref:uncharacterized protein LOC125424914 n=1 Tax=Sphaerodactylus townsendi TaxID=933632 RepID=UPI002026F4E9|nr:uncharacterized protein LOC125424914 [Sphaerodactylus townsendi]
MEKRNKLKRFFCSCWLGTFMENTLEKENMCASATTSAELEREEEEEMAPFQGQRDESDDKENSVCALQLLKQLQEKMNRYFATCEFADITEVTRVKFRPNCCHYCKTVTSYQNRGTDDESDSGHSSEHEISSEEDEGDTPATPPPTPMRSEEQADPLEVDAKKILCVTELFPNVWQGAVDLTLLAKLVQEELNPECCSRCELIELFRSTAASGPEGARAMSKITVIAMKGVNEHVVLKPDLHKDEKTQD